MPTAVLVMLPVVAVTVALSTSVSVWPTLRVAVVAATLPPTVVVPPGLLVLDENRVCPADRMSVKVTFCAALGPRLTSVTV